MKLKNPKKIKFIICDDMNDAMNDIQKATKKEPKYFILIDAQISDYILAYSSVKFTEREALPLWNNLE